MSEGIEHSDGSSKNFGIITNQVNDVITRVIHEDRADLSLAQWEKILSNLSKKILKEEGIKTVGDLKEFLKVKTRLSAVELQKYKDQSIQDGFDEMLSGDIFPFRLSPEDVTEILLYAAQSDKTEEELNLIRNFDKCFDYIKDTKGIQGLIDSIGTKAPEKFFGFFINVSSLPNGYDLLIELINKIHNMDDVPDGQKLDDYLTYFKITDTQRTIVKELLNSKRKRFQLGMEIAGGVKYYMSPDRLLEDPALKNIELVLPEWIAESEPAMSQQDIPKWRAMIARNLSFQQKEINHETVTAEILRIKELREKLDSTALFQGKNILLAVHAQKNQKNDDYFGTSKTVEGLERQSPGKLQTYRAEDESAEGARKNKERIKTAFVETPPPFVFIFDGHGSEDAFYFSGGENPIGTEDTLDDVKITVDEFVELYKRRLEKYPDLSHSGPMERDCFIFGSCLGHNFLRNFYDQLADVVKPIIISAAEYGQESFIVPSNPYGSDFFEKYLKLGEQNGFTHFGDLFRGDNSDKTGNPSLYIPDDSNRPVHLSQRIESHNEGNV